MEKLVWRNGNGSESFSSSTDLNITDGNIFHVGFSRQVNAKKKIGNLAQLVLLL